MSTLNFVFCKKNLELYSQSVYDRLTQEYPDVAIEVKDCVDHCGTCSDIPFVIRNNSVIGGRDPRDLYQKLARGLEYLNKDPLPGTLSYRNEVPAVK